MSRLTTLLTSHKGVDLHAATAQRVMRDRLDGGAALRGLYRCELHAFGNGDGAPEMDKLLATGRYYNPNKHHYGHFEGGSPANFFRPGNEPERTLLPASWPGESAGSDLAVSGAGLYPVLVGGAVPDGCRAVDVAAYPLGQEGPLFSGVLWRLVLECAGDEALALGERLAIARGRKQGLLINPHMEGWRMALREETR